MQTDLKGLEPVLKEILYRALEDLQTTRGALYLLTAEGYRLATQYGFRPHQIAELWEENDLPADVLTTRRAPVFLNGLTADTRFSELLYQADTSRLLLAPIYSRGRLVGFFDLRDKAKQAPFSEQDLEGVSGIVDALLSLFAQKGLFGQSLDEPHRQKREPELITNVHEPGSREGGIVETAQGALSRGLLRGGANQPGPGDDQVRAASLILPAIISLPGALLAAITPASRLAGMYVVASRGAVTDAALEHLETRIRAWLGKRGEPEPVAARRELIQPFGAVGAPLEPSRIQSTLSATVRIDSDEQLVLSVAFEHQPDSAAKAALERFLPQVHRLATLAGAAGSMTSLRERAARHLLEPDLKRFPVLVEHCRRVADLSERLGIALALPADQVETIRLAALVHDVGMRLLDYDRLYRKEHLSSDEIRFMRSHPIVGAAVVAESALGPEVATLVLHHHERPDGTGYPDRLSGDEIPLGARVIGICEAYDAMTSGDSYQTSVPPAAALAKIRRAGGEQFDAELALRFADMMNVGGG